MAIHGAGQVQTVDLVGGVDAVEPPGAFCAQVHQLAAGDRTHPCTERDIQSRQSFRHLDGDDALLVRAELRCGEIAL